MQRFFKVALLVICVAAGSGLVLTLSDPRTFLAWPQAQNFILVTAENRALDPDPLTSSRRPLDAETDRPDPGAAAEALIAAQGGSAFPVLLPQGFGASAETMAASRLRLRLLGDGYYTVFQSVTMEIIIIGTRTTWHAGTALPANIQADIAADYVMPFEDPGPIPAGGAITFGHFGADYSVTFDCVDTGADRTQNCITKEAAEKFVANLTAGTPTDLQIPPALSS